MVYGARAPWNRFDVGFMWRPYSSLSLSLYIYVYMDVYTYLHLYLLSMSPSSVSAVDRRLPSSCGALLVSLSDSPWCCIAGLAGGAADRVLPERPDRRCS